MHRNIHGSDILDSEALLDELDNHLELPALAGVARVGDGDGLAGGILVERRFVLVHRGHPWKRERDEKVRGRTEREGGEEGG